MSRWRPRVIAWVVAAVVFSMLRPTFTGPDGGWYTAYTESLLDWGDLNLVRQAFRFYANDELLVSRTYNLPDFHNHGGVIVWGPAVLYARAIGSAWGRLFAVPGAWIWFHAGQSLVTFLASALTAVLSFALCRRVFGGEGRSVAAVLLVFFGTPCFYYATLAPGNANLLASSFAALFWVFVWRCREFGIRHWLALGAFVGVCMAVKVDLWFLGVPLALILARLWARGEARAVHLATFLGGMIPALALKLVNDYLRDGTLASGELSIINLGGGLLSEALFSSYRGYFFVSPIYYVAAMGLLAFIPSVAGPVPDPTRGGSDGAARQWDRYLLACGAAGLIVKILAISLRYNWHGGTVGARILITEFPIVCLLVRQAMELVRGRTRVALMAACVGFMVWNWAAVGQFVTGDDLRFAVSPPGLGKRLEPISGLLEEWRLKGLGGGALEIKLLLAVPLLAAGWAAALGTRDRVPGRLGARPVLLAVSGYGVAAYGLVTALNLANNQTNVERLRANGFLDRARVVEASYFVDRMENLPSAEEARQYYEAIRDRSGARKMLELQRLIRERLRRAPGGGPGAAAGPQACPGSVVEASGDAQEDALSHSSKAGTGSGWLRKYPCARSQESPFSISRIAGLSTPSAVTLTPRLWARSMMERTMTTSLGFRSIETTNDLSILSSSTGSRRR
jgi:hypothetical protein